MATNVKILNKFNSTVTTSATALYVPASPKTGIITSIMLSSSAAPTVTLEVTGGTATSALTRSLF